MPLATVASTELPHPDKLITSMLKEKSAATPAPMALWLQLLPEALHDHDDEPDSPSMTVPPGRVSVAVSGPVPALPVSETLTLTTAVTPRLSSPCTCNPTLSFAAAATVVLMTGVGDGLGPAVGELVGLAVGEVEGDAEFDGDGRVGPDGDAVGPGLPGVLRCGDAEGSGNPEGAGVARFVRPPGGTSPGAG